MVRTGIRPSSFSVAIRLTRLIPKHCRPRVTPSSEALGTRRLSHTGQVRATMTCSVTSTGTAGTSITSRLRCAHPPAKPVPQSGQVSRACSTRRVGVIRRRAKPWDRGFLGPFFSLGPWSGPRTEAGLLPGIPRGPPGVSRSSNTAIRRSNRPMTAC